MHPSPLTVISDLPDRLERVDLVACGTRQAYQASPCTDLRSGNRNHRERATVWEIANKIHAGRLESVGESVHALLAELVAQNMILLSITLSNIKGTAALPHHHEDPFDRMLIAQAIEQQIPLIASDKKIKLYDLEVIW